MADTALTSLSAATALDADDLFYVVEDGTSVKATGTQVATLMASIIAPGDIGAAADGAVTASGLTMATARLLGRTTASTGAVEEITVGAGLSLSAGALTATGSAVDADDVTYTPTTLADWDGSADPGDVEQALDQLAERVTDVETGFQPLDSDLTTIAGLTATTDNFLQAKSSAWASRTPTQVASDLSSLIKATESLIVACSDETTAITTGTAKVTFRMPYAFTLTAVRASVTTAPTGSTIIIDINEGGSTILSTKLSIDASEKTSTTAASSAVISDASLADDAEMTVDFDQVGSSVAGAGVKVYLIGTRT